MASNGQGEEGQSRNVHLTHVADPAPLISAIRQLHRRRVFAMEQRKRADLALGSFLRLVLGWQRDLPDADRKRINDQAQALIALGEAQIKGKQLDIEEPEFDAWADVILAAIGSRAPFSQLEKASEKHMKALAQQLPVWEWAEGVRGFGPVSLATIVAEAGDLSNYDNPAKLWKRMGLAVMDGVRQGGLLKSASKEAWIVHGYNRARRSRMWNVGDALIKGNQEGPYRTAYLARKEYERAKAEAAGLIVAPAAKIPAKRVDEFMSEGHVHRRSQRYMEKLLLKHLWQEWRRAATVVSPILVLPASTNSEP
jgi:hypothetical protein